jgi:hypothetical protein
MNADLPEEAATVAMVSGVIRLIPVINVDFIFHP